MVSSTPDAENIDTELPYERGFGVPCIFGGWVWGVLPLDPTDVHLLFRSPLWDTLTDPLFYDRSLNDVGRIHWPLQTPTRILPGLAHAARRPPGSARTVAAVGSIELGRQGGVFCVGARRWEPAFCPLNMAAPQCSRNPRGHRWRHERMARWSREAS